MGTSKAFSLRLSFTIKTSLQLLPRESFSTHLASQDLWLPLRDRSSNQLSLVAGRTWHSYSHRTTLNKNRVFKGPQTLPTTVHLGSAQREQAKTRISQFFSGRNLTANFPSCCLSIWLLTDLHVGAGWDSQGSFRELVGVSPVSLRSWLQKGNQNSSFSLEGVFPPIWHPNCYCNHLKDWVPNHLGLEADRSYESPSI